MNAGLIKTYELPPGDGTQFFAETRQHALTQPGGATTAVVQRRELGDRLTAEFQTAVGSQTIAPGGR